MILHELHPRFCSAVNEYGTTAQKLDLYHISKLLEGANVFNAPIIMAEIMKDEAYVSEEFDNFEIYKEVQELLARDNFWFMDETFQLPYYIAKG